LTAAAKIACKKRFSAELYAGHVMNTVEIWPLIDTSLKIALGAMIAGLAIWANSRRSLATGEVSPKMRRLTLLEEISADVGNVNHLFAKYSALIIESTRFGPRWPAARKEELQIINSQLVEEFKKLADAEAKLLMMGEKLAEKTLRLYGAKIAHFRKQVYIGRQDISDREIAMIKQEILQLREQFYDILSKKYDRLLTT
jgi:hypothetical protein